MGAVSQPSRHLPRCASLLWLVPALFGLAACGSDPEFVIRQYRSEPVPGLQGKVYLYVGDIERGKRADFQVKTSSQGVLASASELRVSDRLSFEFEGKTYTLVVVGYLDGTFTDQARVRVLGLSKEQLANADKPIEPSPPPAPPLAAPVETPAPQSLSSSQPPPSPSPEQGMAVAPAPLETGGDACGTHQPTVQERIADCAKKQAGPPVSQGAPDAGASPWQLVTRTASGRQVWLQASTGKLWSDRLGRERFDMAGWCRAKGLVGTSAGKDCTPARAPAEGAPAFAYAQHQPPESWCAEQAEFVTPTRFDESKGGMRLTPTPHSPSVTWSLPTEDEWKAAKAEGAEAVLPHGKDPLFWPASLAKMGVMSLLTKAISARADLTPEQAAQASAVGTVLAVRCVGTPRP